jgi:hypothetical protein
MYPYSHKSFDFMDFKIDPKPSTNFLVAKESGKAYNFCELEYNSFEVPKIDHVQIIINIKFVMAIETLILST